MEPAVRNCGFKSVTKMLASKLQTQTAQRAAGLGHGALRADTMPATGYILQEHLDTKGWGGGVPAWGFWHQDQ